MTIKAFLTCLLLVQAAQLPIDALFSSGFSTFLESRYGSEVATAMSRIDLAPDASYGGGNDSEHMSLNHDPIIVVHGVQSYAGRTVIARDFYEQNGFTPGSVFATSYGPIGRRILLNDTLHCDFVIQMRRFIEAVHLYTQRNVLILGSSTGSGVARKAILGGKCVDTNQKLGKPLTHIVNKFLSIVGLNQGAELCHTLWAEYPFCSNIAGAIPGSQFMQDINKRKHYEGKETFTISAFNDEIVGYANSYLPKADVDVTVTGLLHIPAAIYTFRSQVELFKTGHLTEETLAADLTAASQIVGVNCTGTIVERRN